MSVVPRQFLSGACIEAMTLPNISPPDAFPDKEEGGLSHAFRFFPAAILLIGLGLTAFACHYIFEEQKQRDWRLFDEKVAQSTWRIERRLQAYQQILEDTAGLLMLNPEIEDRAFKAYIDRLQIETRFPGTLAIGFTRALSPENLEGYLEAQQKKRSWFVLRNPGARAEYALMTLLEPQTVENLKLIGRDLLEDPQRREPLILSRDEGRLAVSAPIFLAQGLNEKFNAPSCVQLNAPVYRYGALLDSVEARRKNLIGWASTALNITDLMAGIFGDEMELMRFSLKISDIDLQGRAGVLFDNGGAGALAFPYRIERDILFANRIWRLEFTALAGFLENADFTWLYFIAGLGALGSLLMAAIFWMMVNGRNNALRLARQMTRALRENIALFQSVVEGVNDAVFVKDAGGRYLLVNETMRQWFGLGKKAQLIGKTGDDIFPPEMFKLWQEEDGQVMQEGCLLSFEGRIETADGTNRSLLVTKGPFRADDGEVAGVFGIARDITQEKETQEFIWRQANYDTLTDLPNRRLFRDRLQWEIRHAYRAGSRFAVFFIDLDHFKDVNDSLGHDQGDRLLIEAARRIQSCVRESDTVARLGGDEFVVILPGLTEIVHASRVAQSVMTTMSQAFSLQPGIAYVTASIGITVYPDDGQDDVTLIRNADQAMYAAKAHGRNGFSFFTQTMQTQTSERMRLANALREALQKNELTLVFQPIVALSGESPVLEAEALLRWRHPELGDIPPETFIPIAEETGLIVEIGDWVFRAAADFIVRWKARRDEAAAETSTVFPQVSVNISPMQFLGNTDIPAWCAYLEKIGAPGGSLVVEITESLLLEHNAMIQEKLWQLRRNGLKLAIDDFGTGYSAMSYLKKFAVNSLKIDQSFIRDMENSPNDLAIVEAVILMAHKLGITAIAEGVENEAQRELLRQCCCDSAQGFLLGQPLPGDIFLEHHVGGA